MQLQMCCSKKLYYLNHNFIKIGYNKKIAIKFKKNLRVATKQSIKINRILGTFFFIKLKINSKSCMKMILPFSLKMSNERGKKATSPKVNVLQRIWTQQVITFKPLLFSY